MSSLYTQKTYLIPICNNMDMFIEELKKGFDILNIPYQRIYKGTAAEAGATIKPTSTGVNLPSDKFPIINIDNNFSIGLRRDYMDYGSFFTNNFDDKNIFSNCDLYNNPSTSSHIQTFFDIDIIDYSNFMVVASEPYYGAQSPYQNYFKTIKPIYLYSLHSKDLCLFGFRGDDSATDKTPFYQFYRTSFTDLQTTEEVTLNGIIQYGNRSYAQEYYTPQQQTAVTFMGTSSSNIPYQVARSLPRGNIKIANPLILTPVSVPSSTLIAKNMFYSYYSPSYSSTFKIVEVNGQVYLNVLNIFFAVEKEDSV